MSSLIETAFGDQEEELGAGYLDWDTASGGQNLGLGDFDAITIKFEGSKTDLNGSQYGTAPKNRVLTGTNCTIEAGLSQATAARLKEVVQIVSIAESSTGDLIRVYGINPVGEKDSDIWKQMTFTKQKRGIKDTFAGNIVDFWLVAPAPTLELTYDAATQRFVKLMFQAYASDAAEHLDPNGIPSFYATRDLSQAA